MTLKLVAVIMIALASCVPTNNEIIADGQSRTNAAHDQTLVELEGIKKQRDAANNASIAKWDAKIVFPRCDDKVPKGSECGLISDLYSDESFQKAFAQQTCPQLTADPTADACSQLLISEFVDMLKKRYLLAPEEACPGNDCESFLSMELTVLTASNAKARAQLQLEFDAINAKYSAMSEAVVARFKSQADQIESETGQRLDDASRKRAAMMAAGAALQAGANAAAAAQGPNASGCSSDYECGYGNACVKGSGAFRGTCARSVNANGLPTFQAPDSSSTGPGVGTCSFDTDCSVGFRCVKSSGGLRGNCFK
jgi:hypothetical protein